MIKNKPNKLKVLQIIKKIISRYRLVVFRKDIMDLVDNKWQIIQKMKDSRLLNRHIKVRAGRVKGSRGIRGLLIKYNIKWLFKISKMLVRHSREI